MELSIEDVNETRKILKARLSADESTAIDKESLGTLLKQVRIPGFRPGKAPVPMVRRKYQKELQSEITRRALTSAYKFVDKESGLKIFRTLAVSEFELVANRETAIDFTVDVEPVFSLPDYNSIPIELPPIEISDAEVEAALQDLRRQHSEFRVVERPIQVGDYVKISYQEIAEDGEFESLLPAGSIWSKQENIWEEAGAEINGRASFPAICAALPGLSVGEKKELVVHFGEDQEPAALRGREVTYTLEVHEVRSMVLPELDETFFKTVNAENLEDLRDQLFTRLEDALKGQCEELRRSQVMQTLSRSVEFPLMESLLEERTEAVMAQTMSYQMKRGVPEEEFEKNKEAFYEECRRVASQRVKGELILKRIAEKEGIEVTNEDLNRAVIMEAYRNRRDPKELASELSQDSERLNKLQLDILYDKALTAVGKMASVTIKPELLERLRGTASSVAGQSESEPHHEHGPNCGCDHDHGSHSTPDSTNESGAEESGRS